MPTSTSSTSVSRNNVITAYYYQLTGTDLQSISDTNNIYNFYVNISRLNWSSGSIGTGGSFVGYYSYTDASNNVQTIYGPTFLYNNYAVDPSYATTNSICPFSTMNATFCIPWVSVPSASLSTLVVGYAIKNTTNGIVNTNYEYYNVGWSNCLSFYPNVFNYSFKTSYNNDTATLPVITATTTSTTFSYITNGSSLSIAQISSYLSTSQNSYGTNFNLVTFTATLSASSAVFTASFTYTNSSSSIMTVSAVSSGTIYVGMSCSFVIGNKTNTVYVAAFNTATGTTGTYYICGLNSSVPPKQTVTGFSYILSNVSISAGAINPIMLIDSNITSTSNNDVFIIAQISSTSYALYTTASSVSLTKPSSSCTAYQSIVTTFYNLFYNTNTSNSTGNYKLLFASSQSSAGDDTFIPGKYFTTTADSSSIDYYSTLGNGSTPLYLNNIYKVQNYSRPGLSTPTDLSVTFTLPTISSSSTTQISISSNSIPCHPMGTWDGSNNNYNCVSSYQGWNQVTVTAYSFAFSATAAASGTLSNNTGTNTGVLGWMVDNVSTFAASDGTFQNPVVKETLDIFGGHPLGGQGVYHHHLVLPQLYNWLVDYNHRLVGFAIDGFPILSPCLVKDKTTGSTRLIAGSDLNINNGLTGTFTFSFTYGGKNLQFSFPFAYIGVPCYPYFIGSFYGTPVTVTN